MFFVRWQSARAAAALFVACSMGLTIGCSNEPPRYPASGKITLDGRPLTFASVVFEPITRKGPSAAANVVDGEFNMTSAEGPTAGKFTVRLVPTALEDHEVEALVRQGKKPKPYKTTIPDAYQQAGELEAEVTPTGPNRFNWTLSSKKRT